MLSIYNKITAKICCLFYKGQFGSYPYYYYFESRLKSYKNENFYSELIANLKKTERLKTDTEIKLNDDQIISKVRKKDILKIYKKPCHSITIENPIETEILFYKKRIGKYKVKLEFHFFKNNLIFYNYNFSNLKDISEVTQIIKEKYLVKEQRSILNKNIVDNNNNTILVRNNISLEIYYLCNSKIYLERYIAAINAIKKREEINGKKNKKNLYKCL